MSMSKKCYAQSLVFIVVFNFISHFPLLTADILTFMTSLGPIDSPQLQ
jgi:hypothetical protein